MSEPTFSTLAEAEMDAVGVTILDKAKAAVYGDRERDYGPVKADMECIAALWTTLLGTHIKPEQVPLCMVAVKLARLTYSLKEDSIVDVAGWAAVLERLIKEMPVEI